MIGIVSADQPRLKSCRSATHITVGRPGRRNLPSGLDQDDPRPRHLASRQFLIREHGAHAEVVAARRADEMLERGDGDGQTLWHWIRRVIVKLQAMPEEAELA